MAFFHFEGQIQTFRLGYENSLLSLQTWGSTFLCARQENRFDFCVFARGHNFFLSFACWTPRWLLRCHFICETLISVNQS